MSEKAEPAKTYVQVRIQCSQRIRYKQTVIMEREEWEQLKAAPEREMESEQLGPLGGFLDLAEIHDSEDFEDVELHWLDSEGKIVEEYLGGEEEDAE